MKKIIVISMIALLFYCEIQAKEIYATLTVHAKKSANVAFNYSGIVESFNVDIMAKVKKNDVLATLNGDDLIAVNNATKVALKYAEIDFYRHEKLLAKKLIDKAQLDKFALAYDSVKAQVALEETIYAKTILRAPFDGVITRRMIEIGDLVSGQRLTTAFNIQSEHQRILVVEFDQKYDQYVKIGDAFLYHVDGDSKEYQGVIFRIYPAANSDTRKIAAQVIAKDLKVGLFGEGRIITSDLDNQTNKKVITSQE